MKNKLYILFMFLCLLMQTGQLVYAGNNSVGSFTTSAIDGVVQKFGKKGIANQQDFEDFEQALKNKNIDLDVELNQSSYKNQIDELVGNRNWTSIEELSPVYFEGNSLATLYKVILKDGSKIDVGYALTKNNVLELFINIPDRADLQSVR